MVCLIFNHTTTVGLYPPSGRTSYRQISGSLEAAKVDANIVVSHWNLPGNSAALLQRCLSNFRAIRKVWTRISRTRYFIRSSGKTSTRLVNRGSAKPYIIWKNEWTHEYTKNTEVKAKENKRDTLGFPWTLKKWLAWSAIPCMLMDECLAKSN